MEQLQEYSRFITIFHLLGVILGVGSATIIDLLFFKFLGDKHISGKEAKLMDMLSKVIWVALLLLVITGIMLYIPRAERLDDSAKFFAKLIGVLVLIINGLVLGYFIRPKLTKIDFSNNNMSRFGLSHDTNRKMRIWATVCGAISISSWYFIFVLGALRGYTYPLSSWLGAYAIILFLAIFGSLIFESGVYRKIKRALHS